MLPALELDVVVAEDELAAELDEPPSELPLLLLVAAGADDDEDDEDDLLSVR